MPSCLVSSEVSITVDIDGQYLAKALGAIHDALS